MSGQAWFQKAPAAPPSASTSTTLTEPPVRVLPCAHPLDARLGKELVAGRVPARVPGVEEQAALVLVTDVAREVDPGPGRDLDQAPTTQEIIDARRVFPHGLLALSIVQSVSFSSRSQHSEGY